MSYFVVFSDAEEWWRLGQSKSIWANLGLFEALTNLMQQSNPIWANLNQFYLRCKRKFSWECGDCGRFFNGDCLHNHRLEKMCSALPAYRKQRRSSAFLSRRRQEKSCVCPSVCIYICHLSVCVSVCLPVCPFVCLCLFVWLCPFVCLWLSCG